MGTQHPSLSPHAQPPVAGNKHPNRGARTGGVIHDNTRHTTRFTVIGNHLTQHPDLSLLAIGLACHIQSLPRGARVDIKTLAARFPEGATRIAAALRELEAHGYLRRERERIPGGRIVTRTVSCNQPAARRHANRSSCPDRAANRPTSPAAVPAKRTVGTTPKALPAVPQPACTAPALLQAANDLLADLHRHDDRLLLSEADAAHLAPGVAAWLERDASPTAVRHALTAGLRGERLGRPASVLAHRLATQLPAPPPFRAPAAPPPARQPLQTCDGCDRAFRAPEPGRCRDCRTDLLEAA
ncbi:helix-turn-helix domain-containing protein [Streptomyces sp. NPDC006739]|uniref:helix-turn-helix domain-containing protein n=1 Tax=Streptomyces sp. NPDC006739 TaxID=3364763 RepID=UPI003683F3FC